MLKPYRYLLVLRLGIRWAGFMEAKEAGIQFSVFTNTMSEGTWEHQEARTLATKPEEILYYGIVLFVSKEIFTNLTKKLSFFS